MGYTEYTRKKVKKQEGYKHDRNSDIILLSYYFQRQVVDSRQQVCFSFYSFVWFSLKFKVTIAKSIEL